ncbi:MAG TPA: aminoacyl-tRNA hydrolase [Paenalcaligenes sp.]|nr:aminoacyl-tRNA hydrolase [Paenalcaligenes sp.]
MSKASKAIRCVVGLGNPGAQYELTRHNAGYWLAAHFADALQANFSEEKKLFSWVAKAHFEGQTVLIAKPTTFMNRSGQAVAALCRFYKIEPQEVLVLHDELDLPPGAAKIKFGGGHAGHNGLRDIQKALDTPDFWRLRVGVGHPRDIGSQQAVAAYVLSNPRSGDWPEIELALERCQRELPNLLKGDMDAVAQYLNGAHR